MRWLPEGRVRANRARQPPPPQEAPYFLVFILRLVNVTYCIVLKVLVT